MSVISCCPNSSDHGTGLLHRRIKEIRIWLHPSCRESCNELVTSSPAVNGGASLPQRGTRPARFGFRTVSPGVGGAGFVPRPGASCGTVTCAPIRKRVIASRFLNVALSQAVEPRGSVPAPVTPCRPKAINRACGAPQTWVECGPTPAVASHRESAEPVCDVGMGDTKRWGSRRATTGGLWHGADAIHARRERRDSLAARR
jgi:hypothetical protein